MNEKVDMTHHREYKLGSSFGKSLLDLTDTSPKTRQALLLDLLGEDRTLLAPLRHLVESPNFQELMTEASGAVRVARRDALLSELQTWCNRETLKRLQAFLAGAINITAADHSNKAPGLTVCDPEIATSKESSNRSSPTGYRETAAASQSTTMSSAKVDNKVNSSEDKILILSEQAHTFSLSGNHQRAIALLSDALRLDPAKPNLYMQRASLYAKGQDVGSAVQDFTSVLRLEPKNYEALAQRGQAYLLMGESGKAIDDWHQAASAGHSQARKWLCNQVEDDCHRLLASSQHRQAMRLLNMAIRVAPANANLFFLRGQVNQATMHHGLAISDFNTAIRLEPSHALAHALRGISHKNGGNRAGALNDWRDAVRLGYSKASEWLLSLDNSSNSLDSEKCDPMQGSESYSSREESAVTMASKKRSLAVAMLAGGLMFVGIIHDHYVRNASVSPEPAQESPQSGSGVTSFIEDRLGAARMHSKSAVLACEHQKVIDALDGVDFSSASQAQLEERNNLLASARAAIMDLDAPGRNKYWENCETGVGLQAFDNYDWQYGNDFIGSLFAATSKKCTDPAIQVNAYTNSRLTDRVYSEWISFVPDPVSGRAANISFRIPASALPREGSLWFDYQARCNP